MSPKIILTNRVYSLHIHKAIDYTLKNYMQPLRLEEMAGFLKLNKSYFCNLFKKETGKNYSQFVNEVRIEQSKDLLSNTKLSVLDIALSVGYNNSNYYNMTFKRQTGTTPYQYRKQAV